MSTAHPNKPPEERKRRKPDIAEFSSATADPPRCLGIPTPEEKARRLAELRARLAEAAPEFRARIVAGGWGERS